MAYDRYDTRRGRDYGRDFERGRRDERGFFERAGDEISSWFGDEEAEQRRRQDERMSRGYGREGEFDRGYGRDFDRDRSAFRGSSRDFSRGRFDEDDRGGRSGWAGYDRDFAPRGYGYGSVRNYGPSYTGGYGPANTGSVGYGGGYGLGYGAGNERGYGSSGYGRFDPDLERREFGRGRDTDRHYHAWRQRQLDDLDRDYDEYARENQRRFESDFGTWRQTRQQKRGMLGQIQEHMDVVGSDGETIGKVDCVRGDHIVLTKSDSPDGRHHALSCSLIDTIDGDQVRLDVPAEEAKSRWSDESESRAMFGRGEEREGVNLERSFSGTYR